METSNYNTAALDLSGLNVPANVRSDRDLELEVTKICDALKDTGESHNFQTSLGTSDWKKRMESLKRVQEISLLFDDVVEGNVNINGQFFLAQVNRLYTPLTIQV